MPNNNTIQSRLHDLGLDSLIPDIDKDLVYRSVFPPQRLILRQLEIAATAHPDRADEIMTLHRDILEGNVK